MKSNPSKHKNKTQEIGFGQRAWNSGMNTSIFICLGSTVATSISLTVI